MVVVGGGMGINYSQEILEAYSSLLVKKQPQKGFQVKLREKLGMFRNNAF